MAEDRLTTSLSESVLTLLGFDKEYGAQAMSLISPEIFEPPLDDIAARIIEFRNEFKEPPGQAHLDDIFDQVLSKYDDRRSSTYRRILEGMLVQAETLNSQYIFSRINQFVREQRVQNAIAMAGERYLAGGDTKLDDVERIFLDAIKGPALNTDLGLFLDDTKRGLEYLDEQEKDFCYLGIGPLDARKICPTRGELFLLVAPRKSGKTHFCVHCGKMAVSGYKGNRWNVVHITLEVDEHIVVRRYHQSMLSIADRNESYKLPIFERDDKSGKLKPVKFVSQFPKYNYEDKDVARRAIQRLLGALPRRLSDYNGKGRSASLGSRFHNLVIKRFPSGMLTFNALVNYLDALESIEHFIPDMLIVDYPQLMYLDTNNYRLELGQIGVKLRGLAVERNMAVVAVAQGSRQSERAAVVQSHMVAEDISLIATADNVITLTRGPFEKMSNTARLLVSNARNAEDGFQVCVTQSYSTATFVLDSYNMGTLVDTYVEDIKAIMNNTTNGEAKRDDVEEMSNE